MAKDVTKMSREELEEAVVEQSQQLRRMECQRDHWKKCHDEVQKEYLTLSHIVMQARELVGTLSGVVSLNG